MSLHQELGPDELEMHELASVRVSLEPDISLITLAGQVDIGLTAELDAAAGQVIERDLPVRIDATALTFIDSSGLRFLARIINAATGDARPVVMGATLVIRETIALGGLSDVLELQ